MMRGILMAATAAVTSTTAFVGTLAMRPDAYLSCGPLGWDFWCWLMSDLVGVTRAIFG